MNSVIQTVMNWKPGENCSHLCHLSAFQWWQRWWYSMWFSVAAIICQSPAKRQLTLCHQSYNVMNKGQIQLTFDETHRWMFKFRFWWLKNINGFIFSFSYSWNIPPAPQLQSRGLNQRLSLKGTYGAWLNVPSLWLTAQINLLVYLAGQGCYMPLDIYRGRGQPFVCLHVCTHRATRVCVFTWHLNQISGFSARSERIGAFNYTVYCLHWFTRRYGL